MNRNDIDASWNVNNQILFDFQAETGAVILILVLFLDPGSFKPASAVEEVGNEWR